MGEQTKERGKKMMQYVPQAELGSHQLTLTTQTHEELHKLRDNWTTHHHVIGFRDVDFKLKPSTLVVTLI